MGHCAELSVYVKNFEECHCAEKRQCKRSSFGVLRFLPNSAIVKTRNKTTKNSVRHIETWNTFYIFFIQFIKGFTLLTDKTSLIFFVPWDVFAIFCVPRNDSVTNPRNFVLRELDFSLGARGSLPTARLLKAAETVHSGGCSAV